MNHQHTHPYDDMSPNLQIQEENRKFRNMKRIIITIMVLLILIAVLAIVYILMNADVRSVKEKSIDLSSVTISEPKDEDIIAQELKESVEQQPVEQPIEEDSQVADTTEEIKTGPANDPIPEDAAETEKKTEEGQEEPSITRTESSSSARDAEELTLTPVSFTAYVVQPGDTLTKIAATFGLKPETIIGVNGIGNINDIKAGTSLEIPDRDGQMYTVKKGDSLSVIAYKYDMGYVTLAEVNGLSSPLIIIGQHIFIPERTISKEDYQIVMKSFFVRPAEGIFLHQFNETIEDVITGEKKVSKGLYIKNEIGTPVLASNTGTITEISNDQSGLGRYIVIDHDNEYTSTYGHLDKIKVEVGVSVTQGDEIATIGISGRILEPMLYFEIDKDGMPIDPNEFF